MLLIKLLIDSICGILNAMGGYHWLFCRRFIMPAWIAVLSCFVIHSWVPMTMILSMITLCFGYPKFIKSQFLARGLWLALQAAVIGAGSFILGHLAVYFYIPYVFLAFIAAGLLYNLEQIFGDIIFGMILGSVVFLVR